MILLSGLHLILSEEYWGTGIGNCNEETWLADFTIDAGGWHGALEELIANAKSASDIAIVALGQTEQKIVETALVNKGLSIHGAYAYTPEDCREVIRLMEEVLRKIFCLLQPEHILSLILLRL